MKPKVTKSVHFAPDVKYVCREDKPRPVKKNMGNSLVNLNFVMDHRSVQLPAVVEKYMIRSLPHISDTPLPTSCQDPNTKIIYIDHAGNTIKTFDDITEKTSAKHSVSDNTVMGQKTDSTKLVGANKHETEMSYPTGVKSPLQQDLVSQIPKDHTTNKSTTSQDRNKTKLKNSSKIDTKRDSVQLPQISKEMPKPSRSHRQPKVTKSLDGDLCSASGSPKDSGISKSLTNRSVDQLHPMLKYTAHENARAMNRNYTDHVLKNCSRSRTVTQGLPRIQISSRDIEGYLDKPCVVVN